MRAQATLIVRLDNVRAIIERTLQTLDNNPQIVTPIALDRGQYGEHGRRGREQCREHGRRRGRDALRNGQLLNLAAAGLTEVSRTAGTVAGQTVRQVTDRAARRWRW